MGGSAGKGGRATRAYAPLPGEAAADAVQNRGAGAPVDENIRGNVESHLNVGLAGVRVHTDERSQEANAAMGARAFAFGADVFLGANESPTDLGLMAHELTHVAQQGAAGEQVAQHMLEVGPEDSPAEAQADQVAAAAMAGPRADTSLIVADSEPGPGQMTRSSFLQAMRTQVTATANTALGPIWSAVGCPYIEQWFTQHANTPAADLERLAKRYSGLQTATNARDYIAPICTRVAAGIARWKDGGDVSAELSSAGVSSATQNAAADSQPNLTGSGPSAQRKVDETADVPTARSVIEEMGEGESMDGATASRMGDALGQDFSAVQIHTGGQAQRKAAELGASAFAVGQHVAFGPGQYEPGSPRGDALLAHELAHTVQQKKAEEDEELLDAPLETESEAHEENADQVATGALGRLWKGAKNVARKALDRTTDVLSSGFALQRCNADPQYEYSYENELGAGQNENVQFARLGDPDNPWFNVQMLSTGTTIGIFESEAEALSICKSVGHPGVVLLEDGRYVAYSVTSDGYLTDEIFNPIYIRNAGLFLQRPVSAIVTAVGAVFRPNDLGEPGERVDRDEQNASTENPFQGYLDAHEESGGLEELDNTELFAVFDAALRDNAIHTLATSEHEIRAKSEHFSSGGVGDSEHELIRSTAQTARDLQAEIDDLSMQITLTRLAIDHDPGSDNSDIYERIEELTGERTVKTAQKARSYAAYPMLRHYESVSELDEFLALDEDARTAALGDQALETLANIGRTRLNILNDDLDLWEVPSIVNSTIAGLGFGEESAQRQAVLTEAARRQRAGTVNDIALAVFSIALGVAAVFLSGGLALAAAAGAFGLGFYDAAVTTERYFVEAAAGDTDEDNSESILDPNSTMHWGWLVVAWAGVALDFADVIDAARVGAKVADVASGNRSIRQAAEELAQGDAALLARLRQAAGDFDVDDVVTADMLQTLGARIGANIRIDDALGPAASGVKVNYTSNGMWGLRLTDVSIGAGARVADVLLHQQTVALVQRYSGLTGQARHLWDRIRSFGGAVSGSNPFPPGSAAWESFGELSKLEDLISARRARLDELVESGADATRQQDALRYEIAFLENEVDVHRRVVDTMASEASPQGFIEMGRGTAEAMGSPLALRFPDPWSHINPSMPPDRLAEALRECPYYYRRSANAPGGYELVRKADANAPARQPQIVDGAWTGQFIDDPSAMTRLQRANALISSWPSELQAAYTRFVAAHPGAKVAPVNGVRTTDATFTSLLSTVADDAYEILLPALRRLHPDDSALAAREARRMADAMAGHQITLVSGTEHLRAAFGYRTAYVRGLDEGVSADGLEVHHLLALYLGGDHRELVALGPTLHDRMHRLIETIPFGDGTLAPGSVRGLTYDHGLGVVEDGAIQLYRAVLNGDVWSYVRVP